MNKLITKNDFGIVSYGCYISSFFVSSKVIAKNQGQIDDSIPKALGIEQKTVPNWDEDTATIATAASLQALERFKIFEQIDEINKINALFVGSESHPYAVKPTGTIVKQALGLSDKMAMADLQFACKAGTQALQIALMYIKAGFTEYAMAIGADRAQAKKGDVLEFTAGTGGASFILGSNIGDTKVLAKILATTSVATDTPDFWRRPKMSYPEHAGRFSGEPAYFAHITKSVSQILNETGMKPADFDYCVFHTPNAKFPQLIAKQLGFTQAQLQDSLVVKKIGNTYAAASLLALCAVLDKAKAGQKILIASYGSGSGSDAFILETTRELESSRKNWTNFLGDQIKNLKEINYENIRSE